MLSSVDYSINLKKRSVMTIAKTWFFERHNLME